MASVTFGPSTGTGFVGKGDVQSVLGWNNAAIQKNATSVEFQVLKTTITDSTWSCTNTNSEHQQLRTRTTTTTTQQAAEQAIRNNKNGDVTGFKLTGYVGSPTVVSTSAEGPPLESCPFGRPWVYDHDLSTSTWGSGSVQVSNAEATWYDIYAFAFWHKGHKGRRLVGRDALLDSSTDPASWTTYQAYQLLAKGFGPGFNGPLDVVGQVNSPADRERFAAFTASARTQARSSSPASCSISR